MKLIQATMSMSIGQGKEKKIVPKIVFLWKEVGLCTHTDPLDRKKWNVSHYSSGMTILTGLLSLEEAKFFMQELYDKGMSDWRFTLEEWDSEKNTQTRHELKQVVDELRDTIRRV